MIPALLGFLIGGLALAAVAGTVNRFYGDSHPIRVRWPRRFRWASTRLRGWRRRAEFTEQMLRARPVLEADDPVRLLRSDLWRTP